MKTLLSALQGDLEHSGMTDVVIRREGAPSLLLTLDSRFVTNQTLELLHTSTFTLIGKVTAVWKSEEDEEDMVNLYRRSVLSLVPSLTSAMGWFLFGLLGGIAKAIDVGEIQRSVQALLGAEQTEMPVQSEVQMGEDWVSLLPALNGPAFQILPLAVCA